MTRSKAEIQFQEIAREIAEIEGKKKQVNIAQIKEILKITLQILGRDMQLWPFETMRLLEKYATTFADEECLT